MSAGNGSAEGSERFDSIQILRGVAALMVLVFHVPFYVAFPFDPQLPILYGGVDLFFVISGFIMVVSTRGERADVRGFLRKRLVRIAPLYWLATGVALLVDRLSGVPPVALPDILRSLLFIAYHNDRLGDVQPVLSVGWTLNLEMLFYIVFAATMRLSSGRQVATVGAIFLALSVARLVLSPPPEAVAFFYTSPILLEFVAGMALGLGVVPLRRISRASGVALVIAGCALAIVGNLVVPMPRTVGLGAPALLICAGALVVEARYGLRRWRAARLLGDASYSIYLVHPIVLGLLMPLALRVPWWFAAPVTMAAAIAAGLLVYRSVEQPLFRLLRPERRPQQPAVA